MPPEPRANPQLVGHDDAARTLEAAARSGRMPHAWLLSGPPGIGKATLAYRFARWLLAGMPPGRASTPLGLAESDPVFQRVAASAHADLHAMVPNLGERGRKEVLRAVDARAARRFMTMTAAEGGWRAVVIENLEQSERGIVQNILLKTLEEPPPRTVQIIVTDAADALLPTIRSRCRRIDLHPLAEAAMRQLLDNWLPEMPAAERAGLARIADGAPGLALTLAAGEGLEMQALVERLLAALPNLAPRQALEIAEATTARRDAAALVTFFALLRRAIAASLRAAARGGPPAAWLGARSLSDGAVLWERLGRLADETERLNLDRKQAVLTAFGLLADG